MARAGRKRVFGVRRYPNGQLCRPRRGAALRLATLQHRARHTGLSLEQAADQHAESLEGQLYLAGHLAKAEADAVGVFRSCWWGFITTLPAPVVPFPGLEHPDRGGLHLDDGEDDAQFARRVYYAADKALRRAGAGPTRVVQALVQADRMPLPDDIPHAKAGAAALVDHFGLWGPLAQVYRAVELSPRARRLLAMPL